MSEGKQAHNSTNYLIDTLHILSFKDPRTNSTASAVLDNPASVSPVDAKNAGRGAAPLDDRARA